MKPIERRLEALETRPGGKAAPRACLMVFVLEGEDEEHKRAEALAHYEAKHGCRPADPFWIIVRGEARHGRGGHETD